MTWCYYLHRLWFGWDYLTTNFGSDLHTQARCRYCRRVYTRDVTDEGFKRSDTGWVCKGVRR